MSEPTTAAGRRLLHGWRLAVQRGDRPGTEAMRPAILGIEAEARAAERERIAKAVEALELSYKDDKVLVDGQSVYWWDAVAAICEQGE